MSYKVKPGGVTYWRGTGDSAVQAGTIPAGTVLELDGTPVTVKGKTMYKITLPLPYGGKHVQLKYLTAYTEPDTIPPDEPLPPIPQPIPIGGTRMRQGDVLVYVINDNLAKEWFYKARTLSEKIKIAITNSMYAARRWYRRSDGTWRVDQFSKISFWPEELKYGWPDYFFSQMTERQRELFNGRKFGWRDFGNIAALLMKLAQFLPRIRASRRPPGVAAYNFILCSGALLRESHRWKQWTIFYCQDTNKAPINESYENRPDLSFLQSVCGHNAAKQSFYGSINKNIGRLSIPNACPGGLAAIKTEYVRRVPSVPFKTTIDGMETIVTELCFLKSEIFGFASDGSWYYVLQQKTQNGNQDDFVLHIPVADWLPPHTLPVPWVERQKS